MWLLVQLLCTIMMMMNHLSVKCCSVARSVASPVVVLEQVVLYQACIPCHLGWIVELWTHIIVLST